MESADNSSNMIKEALIPEHKPKIYNEVYRGTHIRVLELDYHDSEQGGIKYRLPENWKEILKVQIEETTGPIAPEYVSKDLEEHAFRGPLGPLARGVFSEKEIPIVPFFGYISKLAGALGRSLLATDIANNAWSGLFEEASATKLLGFRGWHDFSNYSYKYGEISPGEYQLHTFNDGRHLVTSRGLMQEAIRSGEKQITTIWTPKHAERIADYIERQNNWEEKSGVKVERPQDFKYVSPPQESKKMIFYGRPPLTRTVREYQPILPSQAYKIDLLVNENPPNHKTLITMMEDFLKKSPHNKSEKRYHSRIKLALKRMRAGKSNIASIVNTDKVGWRLVKSNYIY